MSWNLCYLCGGTFLLPLSWTRTNGVDNAVGCETFGSHVQENILRGEKSSLASLHVLKCSVYDALHRQILFLSAFLRGAGGPSLCEIFAGECAACFP